MGLWPFKKKKPAIAPAPRETDMLDSRVIAELQAEVAQLKLELAELTAEHGAKVAAMPAAQGGGDVSRADIEALGSSFQDVADEIRARLDTCERELSRLVPLEVRVPADRRVVLEVYDLDGEDHLRLTTVPTE